MVAINVLLAELCIVTMFFPHSIFDNAICDRKRNDIALSTMLLCNLFHS
jgi:hypothetical protein